MEEIAAPIFFIVYALVALVIFGLYIFSIIWSFRDAEARGKSGCLVALLVAFLSWPLGLILWVVFRPNERLPR